MNRYQILLLNDKKPAWYILKKPMKSVKTLADYIDFCAKRHARLIAPETPIIVMDSAIIRISKAWKAPLMVSDQDQVNSLSVAYSYKRIYTPETLPSVPFVILYECSDKKLSPYTKVLTALYSQKEPTYVATR